MGRLKKLVCKVRGHRPGGLIVEDRTASLTEPGGEPRNVSMKVGTVGCERCGAVLDVRPMGIVDDPNRTWSPA